MKTEFSCQVHNQTLEVGISKPLVGYPVREITYMNRQFPNNGIYSLLGCVPTPDSDKGQIELFCPTCKELALEYINPLWEDWKREDN